MPISRNQSAPCSTMSGMFASVSTLSTRAGGSSRHRPWPADADRRSGVAVLQPSAIGRCHSRERLTTLDHLEERGLLAEQVGARTENELDVEIVEPSGLAHLCHGRGEAIDLATERRLDADADLVGLHRDGSDDRALEHPVGVGAQQSAILEGSGFAFGGVDDDGDHIADGREAATVFHLVPVGKPAPPRPRKPDEHSSSMISSGGACRARRAAIPPPMSM